MPENIEIITTFRNEGSENIQKVRENIRRLQEEMKSLGSTSTGRIAAAQAQVQQARERLALVKHPPMGEADIGGPENIEVAKENLQAVRSNLKQIQDEFKTKKIDLSEQLQLEKARLKTATTVTSVNKNIQQLTATGRKISTVYSNAAGDIIKSTEAMETGISRFQFEFLGILFFGMALQRFFGGIARAGISTFRSITEAVDGTNTALTAVSAASTFLAFTIGEAINTLLEPLLPGLLEIVDTVGDWIQQNPELAAGIIGVGLAVGILFSFIAFLISSISI